MPLQTAYGTRIVILCEGDTEELAVRHFIDRQWKMDNLNSIGLDRINLQGHLEKVAAMADLYLDEEDVLGVFTLIDLYGMNRVQHRATDNLEAKVWRVQRWLANQVTHKRSSDFHPHVSVHEIEAWLLAEGAAVARRLADRNIRPDPEAELKNFQNPPSRRLNELFLSRRGKRYGKIIDGRPLFSEIAFDPIYRTCHYFRAFYDQLREVGGGAQSHPERC